MDGPVGGANEMVQWEGPMGWSSGRGQWDGPVGGANGMVQWEGPTGWSSGRGQWDGPVGGANGLVQWEGSMDGPVGGVNGLVQWEGPIRRADAINRDAHVHNTYNLRTYKPMNEIIYSPGNCYLIKLICFNL